MCDKGKLIHKSEAFVDNQQATKCELCKGTPTDYITIQPKPWRSALYGPAFQTLQQRAYVLSYFCKNKKEKENSRNFGFAVTCLRLVIFSALMDSFDYFVHILLTSVYL